MSANPNANVHVRENRSAGELLRELSQESVTLLRQEVALAKAEMTEKASKFGRNAAYLAIGGFVAYAGFLVLLVAITAVLYVLLDGAVGIGWALWLAPLIVGVVVGIVGYVLIQKAIATMKREGLVPHKTAETMRENKEWLRTELTT